jgi:hypothetical protein
LIGAALSCSEDGKPTMAAQKQEQANERRALSSAEASLSRIQTWAEAAMNDRITPGEAVEQILDELAARPALGRVRAALSRSYQPIRPN